MTKQEAEKVLLSWKLEEIKYVIKKLDEHPRLTGIEEMKLEYYKELETAIKGK